MCLCRWEDEARHYNSGGNDTGTRWRRQKGQTAQVGACGGRTSRAILLRGLSIGCTCAVGGAAPSTSQIVMTNDG
uniref:Uncharacterized protein n=1 Tax=Romanomermis culicivorax TaxID=13658 RepID=A0A915IA09_ROMCU